MIHQNATKIMFGFSFYQVYLTVIECPPAI